eukprot:767636-Hanusia_phi.AAC.6
MAAVMGVMVMERSRSLTRTEEEERAGGGSVYTSVTLNGLTSLAPVMASEYRMILKRSAPAFPRQPCDLRVPHQHAHVDVDRLVAPWAGVEDGEVARADEVGVVHARVLRGGHSNFAGGGDEAPGLAAANVRLSFCHQRLVAQVLVPRGTSLAVVDPQQLLPRPLRVVGGGEEQVVASQAGAAISQRRLLVKLDDVEEVDPTEALVGVGHGERRDARSLSVVLLLPLHFVSRGDQDGLD